MRRTAKPIRKCYTCLLNLGDRCWLYSSPRGQWRGDKKCPAFENETVYAEFRQWRKLPTVKTSKEIRREYFRTRPRKLANRAPFKR